MNQSEKPWTAPGLSSRERSADAVEKLAKIMDIEQGLEVVSEAIDAAVRDAAPKWVPVGERLPELKDDGQSSKCSEWVIVYTDYDCQDIACHWENGEWRLPNDLDVGVVTHWQPLPVPPKETTDDAP
jgi:hypothetical protein